MRSSTRLRARCSSCAATKKENNMARVLILGGGFAAISAAQELTSLLGDDEIILVSKSSEFTFYPAIIPCIFGDLDFDNIRFDLVSVLAERGVRFIHGDVESINTT